MNRLPLPFLPFDRKRDYLCRTQSLSERLSKVATRAIWRRGGTPVLWSRMLLPNERHHLHIDSRRMHGHFGDSIWTFWEAVSIWPNFIVFMRSEGCFPFTSATPPDIRELNCGLLVVDPNSRLMVRDDGVLWSAILPDVPLFSNQQISSLHFWLLLSLLSLASSSYSPRLRCDLCSVHSSARFWRLMALN